jgi:hypothetical protein
LVERRLEAEHVVATPCRARGGGAGFGKVPGTREFEPWLLLVCVSGSTGTGRATHPSYERTVYVDSGEKLAATVGFRLLSQEGNTRTTNPAEASTYGRYGCLVTLVHMG